MRTSTIDSSSKAPSRIPKYTHPSVLVVDEVGYLAYRDDAANMLFHVVNDRHRHKRGMIFTISILFVGKALWQPR
jgi:DNA replication protein DnaC